MARVELSSGEVLVAEGNVRGGMRRRSWLRRGLLRLALLRLALLRRGLLPGTLLLAVTACAPAGNRAGSAALPVTDHPLRGEPAPDFSLAARQGGSASLSAYAGQVVLVDFWATWCEPCRLSFPQYQALASRHGKGVVVVAISEDDEDQGIDSFIAETGASFPVAWDGDKSLAQRYRINSMPTLFIIDKNGLIRYVHAGFRPGDEAQIDNAVVSLK